MIVRELSPPGKAAPNHTPLASTSCDDEITITEIFKGHNQEARRPLYIDKDTGWSVSICKECANLGYILVINKAQEKGDKPLKPNAKLNAT